MARIKVFECYTDDLPRAEMLLPLEHACVVTAGSTEKRSHKAVISNRKQARTAAAKLTAHGGDVHSAATRLQGWTQVAASMYHESALGGSAEGPHIALHLESARPNPDLLEPIAMHGLSHDLQCTPAPHCPCQRAKPSL